MGIKRNDIKQIIPDIDDDAMKSLLALIHAETDALKDANDDLQKQLDGAKADVTAANNAKDSAEKALNDYKTEQGKKDTRGKKEDAYRALLKEANVAEKYIPLIMRATDIDSFALGKDGKLADVEKLSESIKSEHADFIVTTEKKGADVSNPPAGGKVGKYTSKEQIMAIKDTAERQSAIAENHEMFGF